MGRASYRVVFIAITVLCAVVPAPAAADRLLVPGGAASLRRVTGIPDHVPDSMLLSEAARTWFGVREPVPSDARRATELLEYLTTSKEPLQPGPWLPLSTAAWMRLLQLKAPGDIAPALARNRNAMLLYRGFTGVDDRTLAWFDTQPALLSVILGRSAAAFATVGPWLSVGPGGVLVPGGAETAARWREIAGADPSDPARFITAILEKDNSRIGWMFSAIAALDPARARVVMGERGSNLAALAAHFVKIAPEWSMLDRAFSRPMFDPSVVLMLLHPAADGSFAGSEEFWRAVFRGEAPRATAGAVSLTVASLMNILFEDPAQAHARWELFALGQRMLRTAQPTPQMSAALNAAQRFPVLATTLERMGALTPGVLQEMADAAARIMKSDADGRRGDLAAWQAALVTLERSAMSGGIDRAETESVLTSFARLPLASPRQEITAWFMDVWLDRLLRRPGAPTNAEEALLRTMAGDLRASGAREAPPFNWEDLPYTLAAEHRAFARMEQARTAQDGATLTDAWVAWKGAADELGAVCTRLENTPDDAPLVALARRVASARSKRDGGRLERERRTLAEAIVARALPLIAYAAQQAASDAPALGADAALRHDITVPNGPESARRRPWQFATQVAFEARPWHLAGSLLSLDIPLASWYLRTNGDAPMGTPIVEDPDAYSMALFAVLGSAEQAEHLAATLSAIDAGRSRVAAAPDLASVQVLMASRGVDPWRVRALTLDAASPSDVADRLIPSEAWRIGSEGAVPMIPAIALDGCPCFEEMPFAPMVAEGRPSNGMIGALVPGLSLRIASFLKARGLPLALLRPLAGGVAFDVIHSASGIRTDDLLALDVAAARITDARLEEHVLALIADGTLAAPSTDVVR